MRITIPGNDSNAPITLPIEGCKIEVTHSDRGISIYFDGQPVTVIPSLPVKPSAIQELEKWREARIEQATLQRIGSVWIELRIYCSEKGDPTWRRTSNIFDLRPNDIFRMKTTLRGTAGEKWESYICDTEPRLYGRNVEFRATPIKIILDEGETAAPKEE